MKKHKYIWFTLLFGLVLLITGLNHFNEKDYEVHNLVGNPGSYVVINPLDKMKIDRIYDNITKNKQVDFKETLGPTVAMSISEGNTATMLSIYGDRVNVTVFNDSTHGKIKDFTRSDILSKMAYAITTDEFNDAKAFVRSFFK